MPELRTAQELGVARVDDVITRLFQLDGEVRGDEYWMLCPDPDHNDRRPSASVNLITGYWHCFSCGAGGDLIGLGARALDKPREDIEELLTNRSPQALLAMLESLRKRARAHRTPTMEMPAPRDYADGPLDELLKRGFTEDTLRRWDVRYVPTERLEGSKGPFNIYSAIGIPIMDRHKRVVAWCYRRTEASPDWMPKYLYSGGVHLLRSAWFGVQYHADVKDIVVVEGALDAMWCDQCGVPAIAMLGASMVSRKVHWLARYRTVTLLGDLDAAGAMAVRKLGRAVSELTSVRVAQYSDWMRASDPQELNPVDLEIVIARAVPWTRFMLKT